MTHLIFVSMENWDEIWRRNQFLCAGFVRRFPQMRLLFVGLPHDISHQVRRGKLTAAWRADALAPVPEYPNITLLRPLKLLPNSIPLCRRFNEWLMRRQVRAAARTLGMQSPLLWLNPHSAVHLAGRLDEAAVIYDITDDWTQLTQSPALTQWIRAQDAALCRKADAVIVCSERLRELKSSLVSPERLHLIPNGVDAAHYARVLDGDGPLPATAANWPRPVLGYTGTLHPDRVDVGLIAHLANAFPAGTIALIGPDYLTQAERETLERCGNVIRTGAVPYREIPEYMRAFDVCITPHRMTPFTESLNPIKLWEYLAAGKPIVSTDVAGFRDYPTLVRLAPTREEFVAQVRLARDEGTTYSEKRRAEARRHSWDSRVAPVVQVIEQALARPRP